MTVAPTDTETAYALVGTGLGPFSTVWPYANPTDVTAQLDLNDGNGGSPLEQGGDYVLAANNPTLTNGGWVTLAAYTMPAGGWPTGAELRLARMTPRSQPSAFGEAVGFSPQASEQALDNVERQVQELTAQVGRAVSVPVGEEGLVLPTATERAGKLLGFDTTGAATAVPGTITVNTETASYESVMAASLSTIPAGTSFVAVMGFDAPGDGGNGLYVLASSPGAGPGRFQSVDGAWWTLVPDPDVNLLQFGCQRGASDNTNNFNAALSYAQAVGCNLYIPAGVWNVAMNGAPTNRPGNITVDNFRIYGAGAGAVLVNTLITAADPYNSNWAIFKAQGHIGLRIEMVAVKASPLAYFIDCSDCRVSKCRGDGLIGSGYLVNTWVEFDGCTRCVAQDNNLTNFNFHIYFGAGTANPRCQDCIASGNQLANNVAFGSFTASFPVGVYVYEADHVVINGNTFTNIYSSVASGTSGTGMGYGVYEGDGSCLGLTVTGNSFNFTGNGTGRATCVMTSQSAVADVGSNVFNCPAGANVASAVTTNLYAAQSATNIHDNEVNGGGFLLASQAILLIVQANNAGLWRVENNQLMNGGIYAASNGPWCPNLKVRVAGNGLYGATMAAGDAAIFLQPAFVEPEVVGNEIVGASNTAIWISQSIRPRINDNNIQDCDQTGLVDGQSEYAIILQTATSGGELKRNRVVNSAGLGGNTRYGLLPMTNAGSGLFKLITEHNVSSGIGGVLFYDYIASNPLTAPPTAGWDIAYGDFFENQNVPMGGAPGWYSFRILQTTLTADATNTATINVASTSGIANGDMIMLIANAATLDQNAYTLTTWFNSTVLSFTATTITMSASMGANRTFTAATGMVRVFRFKAAAAIAA